MGRQVRRGVGSVLYTGLHDVPTEKPLAYLCFSVSAGCVAMDAYAWQAWGGTGKNATYGFVSLFGHLDRDASSSPCSPKGPIASA